MAAGHPGDGDAAADPKRRQTDADFAPNYETAFADGYPFLIISEVGSGTASHCFLLLPDRC